MKKIKDYTLEEILQKLEIIGIQLKSLFGQYQEIIKKTLMVKHDFSKEFKNKEQDEVINKIIDSYNETINAINGFNIDLTAYEQAVNHIFHKVKKTKSTSLIKTTEHQLYKIDEAFINCSMYLLLFDSSSKHINEMLSSFLSDTKKIMN